MPYVVTEPCIGCIDSSCTEACPANCFYAAPLTHRLGPTGIIFAGSDEPSRHSGMLMINPDECTSCGACETECPVEAIYEDCSVPEDLQEWIAVNAWYTRSLSGEQRERLQQVPPKGNVPD